MANEAELLLALEMVTEGKQAAVPETLRPHAQAFHKAARPWARRPEIQGFGIAEKISGGEQLDEVVFKVYVDKKRPLSKLSNPVPKSLRVEGIAAALPTDVEEIGKVAKEPNTSRVRPAIPGFSVGHVKITAGTLGCLVRKTGDLRTLYILSNSHVLANEGLARKGDKILQPGRADGGRAPRDVIALLADWVPFQFASSGFPNLVDAAIAKVKGGDATSSIRLIGVPQGVSQTVRRGMQVQKTGRTTDYTVGVVKDVNYRLALQYQKPGGGQGRVGFKDQILCTRYTAPGDSGSAVLNMRKKVVGLHFAGSDSSSIFNRIQHVLDALSIEVVADKI